MQAKLRYFIVASLALLAVSVPFVFAFQYAHSETVFGGFLLNPIDGNTYLAKMQQGFRGEWKFVLPYTAEKSSGAYLFLFYLLLGHISRLINISLVSLFHAVRLIGSIFLLYSIWKFVSQMFDGDKQFYAFVIMGLGSGLGWLAVLGGNITSDFWVAEAYPFLSMYTTPHFSIGLGLMIMTLIKSKRDFISSALIGLTLAILQPFSVVILLLVLILLSIIELIDKEKIDLTRILNSEYIKKAFGISLFGLPLLLYQYLSIQSDPLLAIWNFQNQTPTPSVFDLLISFSPALFLSVFGIKAAWKTTSGRVLLVWGISSIILIFVPWNLSRRFLTGFYVPVGGLAVFGLDNLFQKYRYSLKTGFIILLILIVPTNIIVLFSGIQAIIQYDQNIFYSSELEECFSWMEENIKPDALILAEERIGLLIPSQTGRRVIYGHPFETANAQQELLFVNDFFSKLRQGTLQLNSLYDRDIDYLLITDPELHTDILGDFDSMKTVYQSMGIYLYQISEQ
jgi:hypothetical protein